MIRKIVSLMLAVLMTATAAVPAAALDQSEVEKIRKSFITRGTYEFTIAYGDNAQGKDNFVFNEECFRESSFRGCAHLALLSSQAENAAASRHGDGIDKYGRKMDAAYKNIANMLKTMGFTDVQVNNYYKLENLEDSIGVAVGRRALKVKGKTYTLLAIMPRGDDYRQEWAGNFNVGSGDIHEGFKEARDEILRFVKKYISEHNIKGKLKVWITGHSRGGAVGNMLGGFFAGGGAAYFGSAVTVSPEDVYCYTTATPRNIKDGASKAEELSVSGPRGGAYAADTPGKAYNYTGEGTVDLSDPVYGGIRNYSQTYDLITYLPPESWGFECYGKRIPVDEDGAVSEEAMLAQLEKVDQGTYDLYVEKARKQYFKWMKFNMTTLRITEDTSVPEGRGIEAMVSERIAGLTANAKNNNEYVDGGFQNALIAFGGIYGMLDPFLKGKFTLDASTLRLLVQLYDAYVEDRNRGSVSQASVDDKLRDKVDETIGRAASQSHTIYGDAYYADVLRHIDNIKANMTEARALTSFLLFYKEGGSSGSSTELNNAVTLLSNIDILMMNHYKELYLAWDKARCAAAEDVHDTGEAEYQAAHIKHKQNLKVSASRKTIKAAVLKRRSKTIRAITVKGAEGKVTYKKMSGSSRLKVNKKSGKITVRKGTKKGTYTVRVRVRAAGNSKYLPASKIKKVKVRIS